MRGSKVDGDGPVEGFKAGRRHTACVVVVVRLVRVLNDRLFSICRRGPSSSARLT